jgi:hypothetical protein
MSTPDTGTAAKAVTIHQSATESMREGRKFAESRMIDAMTQPVQMIPAIAHGPALAKRLLMTAQNTGEGWLKAPDNKNMRDQLLALFSEDSFDDQVAAEYTVFLGQKLEGLDRHANDEFVDEAYKRGLDLKDGDGVPPLRRLIGLRLDVLREWAVYRGADDLVPMIDGGTFSVGGIRPTATAEQSTERPMTRMALIQKYVRRWPTIESALNNAGRNGLDAAKAGERSWMESKVLEWAYSKGNLESPEIKESPKQANWVQGLGGR